ncbi:hypothetical protein MKZ08_09885 [Viridibacillus sp. FSL R5-0477]|uniref:Uncharacterized protein n=1 Tax=Viridibacillus arenosi FSL R5-213 TaxID=1227360 RepID=W4F2J0_9BACL|nr:MULTISPECIES: hypothetical protein [Viridibacillus]ETT86704.1 hypothetical protein C176_08327 [Viridibacillus arenosi FSL R5-213]OMC84473.1 hypothetical protein BK128_16405 [Viridibacillus sp. FSL H7-0596]OMC89526.1 hypothetical protein BK137_17395 [Viridibacillus arenosi]
MFKTIRWRMYIKVKSKEKAQKVIKRLKQEIGDIEVVSLQPYWKDETLFELDCETTLMIEEPEKSVFEVLRLSNQISNDLYVTGPILYENNRVQFEGVCSSSSVVGIHWFHFRIANFD